MKLQNALLINDSSLLWNEWQKEKEDGHFGTKYNGGECLTDGYDLV